MKKALVCFILLLSVAGANAQKRFEKGDWFVGAQSTGLDFSSRFHDGGAINFNFAAMGGWFFADRFAVDASAGVFLLKVRKQEITGAVTYGAGVRYYPVGNLFARIGYNGNAPVPYGDANSYIDAKIGYDLFLSDKVFFEPAVYFEKCIDKPIVKGAPTENVLGLSIGIGVKF